MSHQFTVFRYKVKIVGLKRPRQQSGFYCNGESLIRLFMRPAACHTCEIKQCFFSHSVTVFRKGVEFVRVWGSNTHPNILGCIYYSSREYLIPLFSPVTHVGLNSAASHIQSRYLKRGFKSYVKNTPVIYSSE